MGVGQEAFQVDSIRFQTTHVDFFLFLSRSLQQLPGKHIRVHAAGLVVVHFSMHLTVGPQGVA